METQTIKQFSESREQRARQILAQGNPECLEDNTWLVPSQFSDKKYLVTFLDTYSCNCPDFQHNCKGKGHFVRKSVRQNLTPADKCGVGVNGNAWETMLLKSIKHNNSLNAAGKEDLRITP